MTKFKIGDRVAVYHYGDRYTAIVKNTPDSGKMVVHVCGSVREFFVHEKQCRRLTPAKPKRRIWLHESERHVLNHPPLLEPYHYTEFVEVRKKVKK